MGGEEEQEALNRFLRSHKILEVDRQMVVLRDSAYWSFAVSYLEGSSNDTAKSRNRSSRVDYKNILDTDSFKRFNAYRSIRKEAAQKEGVPVYAIFTNSELAEIAKLGPTITLNDLLNIPGIGHRKVEKYATYFINHEASE